MIVEIDNLLLPPMNMGHGHAINIVTYKIPRSVNHRHMRRRMHAIAVCNETFCAREVSHNLCPRVGCILSALG
eukprot:2598314-Pleurochrysis_carterae.AAC.1